MFPREIIAAYNAQRDLWGSSNLCHAPFANLNFTPDGTARVCCYTWSRPLGRYPEHSIRDLWHGEPARALRAEMTTNTLPDGCFRCAEQLAARNFEGFKGRHYDHYASRRHVELDSDEAAPPVSMEFELGNTCNLECVMCNGLFSSSIRKNVEKLPPIVSPYDQQFVEQLEEFIPHLEEAKFLGGEPFLIPLYYEIWERIADLNPTINNVITTNGTVLNRRARAVLDRIRAEIVVSIDSLVPENFERIRRNANFGKVLENIHELAAYCREKGTPFYFAVCPMQTNWRELPDFLAFCDEHDAAIWFNTVWEPDHASLRTLPLAQLEEVVEYLKERSPTPQAPSRHWIQNRRKYAGVIRQVESWAERARRRPQRGESLWLDLPDAPHRALSSAPSAGVHERTTELIDRGYTVLPKALSHRACDEALAAFESWCARNREEVARHRDANGHMLRLANLHLEEAAVANLFSGNESALELLDFCLGYPAAVYTSLFLERGVQQGIHHDLPYFRTEPEGFFFGVYVALEDIDEGNGPFVVVEGAHRLARIDPVPIRLRHIPAGDPIPSVLPELWNDYQQEVLERSREAGLRPREVHLAKGDVLVWHPALPKRSAAFRDAGRTGYSVVFHATPECVPVYQADYFFNPRVTPPAEPVWQYRTVGGRKMAVMKGPSF